MKFKSTYDEYIKRIGELGKTKTVKDKKVSNVPKTNTTGTTSIPSEVVVPLTPDGRPTKQMVEPKP